MIRELEILRRVMEIHAAHPPYNDLAAHGFVAAKKEDILLVDHLLERLK